MAAKKIQLISWNVNGIRAATKKGMVDWLKKTSPEIIGLQEVRAWPQDMPDEVTSLPKLHQHYTEP
nr:endonuclease/exonuclease/phosphatase family protein [Myxococcota bacterium]